MTFVQDKDGSKISNSQVSTSKMNEKIIQNKSIDKQNHLGEQIKNFICIFVLEN